MEPPEDGIEQLGFKVVEEDDADEVARLKHVYGFSYAKKWDECAALIALAVKSGSKYTADYLQNYRTSNNQSLKKQLSSSDSFLTTTAIYSKDIANVEYLLELGADVNGTDFRGWTLLGNAVYERQLEIADLLLIYGANPNIANDKAVPLVCDVRATEKDLVKLLLEYGADINMSGDNGHTALCVTIRIHYWDYVDLLLCYKPCIGSEEIGITIGYRELDVYDEMVAPFRKHGTPLKFFNGDEGNQFFDAVREGDIDFVKKQLQSNTDILAKNADKTLTPLHLAAFCGQSEIAQLLLEHGVKVLPTDGYGKTPGDYFTKKANLSMLNVFLSLNDCVKDSLLLCACKHKRSDFVGLLLQHGASVFIRSKHGRTPLHLSCYLSDIKSVRLLLEYGADPNSVDDDGRAALHSAEFTKANPINGNIFELLYEYGADINLSCRSGHTPLSLGLYNASGCHFAHLSKSVHHLVRLKAADMPISDHHMFLWEEYDLDSFYTEQFLVNCKKEVKAMRNEQITSKLTLFDILTENKNTLAKLAGNDELVGRNYSEEFPVYKNLIAGRLKIGEIRRRFIENGCEALRCMCPGLPDLCGEKILLGLSSRNLLMLCRGISQPCEQSRCCYGTPSDTKSGDLQEVRTFGIGDITAQ